MLIQKVPACTLGDLSLRKCVCGISDLLVLGRDVA